MQRGDLIAANGRIVDELGSRIAELTPEAGVVVTTEPVDRITERFLAASGLPRERGRWVRLVASPCSSVP